LKNYTWPKYSLNFNLIIFRLNLHPSCIWLGFSTGILPRIFNFPWWNYCAGFYIGFGGILIIFAHELGHAFTAKLCSLKVYGISLSGFGGICVTSPPITLPNKLLYFSGGIIFQTAILFLYQSIKLPNGFSPPFIIESNRFVFLYLNSIKIIINLLPIMNTDGMNIFRAMRDKFNKNLQ